MSISYRIQIDWLSYIIFR